MPDKTLQHSYEKPEINKDNESDKSEKDAVQKAKDAATIAEANQKAEFAKSAIKDIKQLQEEQKKLSEERLQLDREREEWDKQKESILDSLETEKEKWEISRQEEIEKIRKVKTFWESRQSSLEQELQVLAEKENALVEVQHNLDSQEQRINNILGELDNRIEMKKAQISELQKIINHKAHDYYAMFKRMLKTAEGRYNYNYNMARADQWHNFKERVEIITRSLHEMLFG